MSLSFSLESQWIDNDCELKRSKLCLLSKVFSVYLIDLLQETDL